MPIIPNQRREPEQRAGVRRIVLSAGPWSIARSNSAARGAPRLSLKYPAGRAKQGRFEAQTCCGSAHWMLPVAHRGWRPGRGRPRCYHATRRARPPAWRKLAVGGSSVLQDGDLARLLTEACATSAQVRVFLGCGVATEEPIPVREAAKPLNQCKMLLRELQIALEDRPPCCRRGFGDLGRQADGLTLILDRLAVLKRKYEKRLLDGSQVGEVPSCDGLSCCPQRLGVVRERPGGTAPQITRELVEQHNEGERRPRRSHP